MSLRWFHLVFLLLVMMGADLFGGWALHDYRVGGSPTNLLLGVVSLVGGLGLAVYVFWLVRSLEKAGVK